MKHELVEIFSKIITKRFLRITAFAPLTRGSVGLPAGSPAGVYAVQVGTLGSTLIRT